MMNRLGPYGGRVLALMSIMVGLMHSSGLSSRAPESAAPRASGAVATPDTTAVKQAYGKLPLGFEENRGQTDARVHFFARGSGYTLFLAPAEAVVALRRMEPPDPAKPEPRDPATPAADPKPGARARSSAVVRMKLVGGNASATVAGVDVLPGASHYLIGNDPAKWRTDVPRFAKVHYTSVYPGVDLAYYGNQGQLEYDFLLSPGADPASIELAFEGASGLEIDAAGDLVLHTAGGTVHHRKPFVYQEAEGARQEIAARYVLTRDATVRFEVAEYDRARPLVIDPVLLYSTYLGGSDSDSASGIAVDRNGYAYVTGWTASLDFPTTPGAYDRTLATSDAYIAKLDPNGSSLVYSTFVGGSDFDRGSAIAVDSGGNAYITGYTDSIDFPIVGAFDASPGGTEAFVAKLGPAGATLVFSSYLGGAGADYGYALAVDSAGNAYVAGQTDSIDFPVTFGAFQTSLGGSRDAFITKVASWGGSLVYSTYLGGSDSEGAGGIAVNANGNAFVSGPTASADFPTRAAFQSVKRAGYDAFVTKLNPGGGSLVYSTFLGGGGTEFVGRLAVDGAGSAYVVGATSSANFPVTPGAFDTTLSGLYDVFITKFGPGGQTLMFSTYVGGTGDEIGAAAALDNAVNVCVTGWTSSLDFPTTPGVPSRSNAGGTDAFVLKLDSTGAGLIYSTYVGGPSFEVAEDVAVLAGHAYVAGHTGGGFPTTPGAFDRSFAGFGDGFVLRLSR